MPELSENNQSQPFREANLKAWQLDKHLFPGYWQTLLASFLAKKRLPDERWSSCFACPQVAEEGFRPDYRCCTYIPRMPNFLLGFALQTPAGKEAIQRAEAMNLLLPEGMHAQPYLHQAFMRDQDLGLFGKSQDVLCPMLEVKSGLCQVHAFRNAVCSLYFCQPAHGSTGLMFWSQLQSYITQLERRISQWLMRELGLADQTQILDQWISDHKDPFPEGRWPLDLQQQLWGNWWQKSFAFYEKAALLCQQQGEAILERADTEILQESAQLDRYLAQLSPQKEEMEEELGFDPPLQELRDNIETALEKLWQLPAQALKLSPFAELTSIPAQSSKPEKQARYILSYRLPQQSKARWRLILQEDEYRCLSAFAGEGLRPEEYQARGFSLTFLTEMFQRKALWSV